LPAKLFGTSPLALQFLNDSPVQRNALPLASRSKNGRLGRIFRTLNKMDRALAATVEHETSGEKRRSCVIIMNDIGRKVLLKISHLA
jgi:hypothetical protein